MKKFILALCLITSSAFAGALDRDATDLEKAIVGMDVCGHLGFEYRYQIETCTTGVKNAISNHASGADYLTLMCGGLKSDPFVYSYCLEGVAKHSGQIVDLSVCDQKAPTPSTYFGTTKEARHASCQESLLIRSIR